VLLPTDLAEVAEILRQIGEAGPSDDGLLVIDEALHSKFEGTQAGALKALGQWYNQPATDRIASFLESALLKKHAWALRGAAINQLAACLAFVDPDWALDRYFAQQNHLVQYQLLPLVSALPPQAIRARILKELMANDAKTRLAALLIVRHGHFHDKKAIACTLLTDEDSAVRRLARHVGAA